MTPSAWQSTGTLGCRGRKHRRSACQTGETEADDQSRLRGKREDGFGLVAHEPAVVLFGQVVRDAGRR